MAANKVILNGNTHIDLTEDTATESDVAKGKTFHLANGEQATGTAEGGSSDMLYALPAPGTYYNELDVSLYSTSGHDIWYTTDDSDPADAGNVSRNKYNPMFLLHFDRDAIVKAVTQDENGDYGAVQTFNYTIDISTKTKTMYYFSEQPLTTVTDFIGSSKTTAQDIFATFATHNQLNAVGNVDDYYDILIERTDGTASVIQLHGSYSVGAFGGDYDDDWEERTASIGHLTTIVDGKYVADGFAGTMKPYITANKIEADWLKTYCGLTYYEIDVPTEEAANITVTPNPINVYTAIGSGSTNANNGDSSHSYSDWNPTKSGSKVEATINVDVETDGEFTASITEGGTWNEGSSQFEIKAVANSAQKKIAITFSETGVIYNEWSKTTTHTATLTVTNTTSQSSITVPINFDIAFCLTEDMPIMLADNTEKRIGALTENDKVLAINPETMQLIADDITEITSSTAKQYDRWTWSDGTVIKTALRHRFYNVERQAMIHIHDFELGEHTVNYKNEVIALVKHEVIDEDVKICRLFTKHQNYFVNGLLSGNKYTTELHLHEDMRRDK